MGGFDVKGAKAAGYNDDEIAQFMQQSGLQAAQARQDAAAGTHTVSTPSQLPFGADPSEGGGTLQLGAWDTHIPTPQPVDRVLAGTGRGLVHTGRSIGNAVGLIPDSVMTEEKATDAPLMNTDAGTLGNLLGETAITAPLGAGAMQGIGAVGKLGAALAANPIGNAAIQGGIQGFATSEPGHRGVDTALGSITGGVMGAGQSAVDKLVNGLSRSPEASRLLQEGVSLTPGQLNAAGPMNQFEQAAESIPGAKQIIEPAREAAEHQYQAVIIGKGAAPGAVIKPSANISDMLQQAYDSYKPLYDQANGYPVSPRIMRTQGADIPLTNAFQTAAKAPGVPKGLQASENDWLQDRLTQLPGNPQSEDLLKLRSDIRQRARTANLKTDTDSGHIANINSRAEQSVTDALQSQLPPEPLKALSTADSNYGNYKIIENAVAKSKDNLAGLTPQKLSQAVYDAIPDGAYARGGGGPLRDLAKAGTEVFQNVSPPTGARVLTLGAGALGALHPAVGVPAAVSALGLTGTKTGRALAAGQTGPQQAVQNLVTALQKRTPDMVQRGATSYAGRLGTAAGTPVVQQALPQALAAALLATQAKPSTGSGP